MKSACKYLLLVLSAIVVASVRRFNLRTVCLCLANVSELTKLPHGAPLVAGYFLRAFSALPAALLE